MYKRQNRRETGGKQSKRSIPLRLSRSVCVRGRFGSLRYSSDSVCSLAFFFKWLFDSELHKTISRNVQLEIAPESCAKVNILPKNSPTIGMIGKTAVDGLHKRTNKMDKNSSVYSMERVSWKGHKFAPQLSFHRKSATKTATESGNCQCGYWSFVCVFHVCLDFNQITA